MTITIRIIFLQEIFFLIPHLMMLQAELQLRKFQRHMIHDLFTCFKPFYSAKYQEGGDEIKQNMLLHCSAIVFGRSALPNERRHNVMQFGV